MAYIKLEAANNYGSTKNLTVITFGKETKDAAKLIAFMQSSMSCRFYDRLLYLMNKAETDHIEGLEELR